MILKKQNLGILDPKL